MARILVVKHLFPYPPHQGTRRVSLALLRDLATRHDVVYLCQLEQRAERRLIPKVAELGVRVVAPLMPNHRSPLHRLLYKAKNRLVSRLTGTPELTLYWSNIALRRNLERLDREFRPELTIIENWETYPLRRFVRHGRALLLAHDAAFQILARAAAAATEPAERIRRELRLHQLKHREVTAWQLYDAILTLTEEDRRTVERELAASPSGARPPVRHLPVPVPEPFFAYGRPASPGHRVGFLGTFRADFNRDALAYILDEVWPALRRRVPDAELVLAGNGYQGPLKARAIAAGARWLGFVDDLRSFYETIDVLLVPLRFGGGVRIRILEALAAGAPVVATPVAVAGLTLRAPEHCLVAEGADALAEQMSGLLADPGEATRLGERGQRWCAAQHGVEALRPRRLAVIEELRTLLVKPQAEPTPPREGGIG